jgi:hypothetical protein
MTIAVPGLPYLNRRKTAHLTVKSIQKLKFDQKWASVFVL